MPHLGEGKHKLKEVDQQSGSWMRATTLNLAWKSMVRVAGLEEDDSETVSNEQPNDLVECENPEAGEDVVLSSETDGPNLIRMEMLRGGSEVNENGLKGIQTE